MKPRLLILGASGFVGSQWAAAARANFDVTCAARRPTTGDPNWLAMDITDPASVRAAFDAVRPQHVTLLAALSDIDRCQREPQLAEQINVDGAAARRRGLRPHGRPAALHVDRCGVRRHARLLSRGRSAVATKLLRRNESPRRAVDWRVAAGGHDRAAVAGAGHRRHGGRQLVPGKGRRQSCARGTRSSRRPTSIAIRST